MPADRQRFLIPEVSVPRASATGTFTPNNKLPVHRWYRFSAGFSAAWAQSVIREHCAEGGGVLDPYVGSGTVLLASEDEGVPSYGVEAHPFVRRVAAAKLLRKAGAAEYRLMMDEIDDLATDLLGQRPDEHWPKLINKCYSPEALRSLSAINEATNEVSAGSDMAELAWLTLVCSLRAASSAGTAQWQYVLPRKRKARVPDAFEVWASVADSFHEDMALQTELAGPAAVLVAGDARTCDGVPDGFASLVVTSPPYPNNYDYADATRLEMTFFREVEGWSGLHDVVRRHLMRSCTQHVAKEVTPLEEVISSAVLAPIAAELRGVTTELSEVRLTKVGKKAYHEMIAFYFLDSAATWHALRRTTATPSKVCFVIGDSAPYGVYVPVVEWLSALAVAAGFKNPRFEKIRDRNVKWKNRKHRVPLVEGRLWVEG